MSWLLIDGSVGYVLSFELEKLDASIPVYNIEVDGFHTYFVGDGNGWVLVHNQYGKPYSQNESTKLLDDMPELTGTTREKLLSASKNNKLSTLINQLYRSGAATGNGGTAAMLTEEFYRGSSDHLQKATMRLTEINRLLKCCEL